MGEIARWIGILAEEPTEISCPSSQHSVEANKGGFFRAFTTQAPDGEYWLHAHVMTGEIDLLGKNGAETR